MTNLKDTTNDQYRSEALIMHLTPDEATIVEEHRAKKEKDRLAHELYKTTLLLVGEWMAFQDKSGMGLTYSTFCDDFGADQYIPMDLQKHRRIIYEMLGSTIKTLYQKSREVVGI